MIPEHLSVLRDVLRRSFWFLPAIGLALGVALGFALPALDGALEVGFGVFTFTEVDSARGVLETIATVTVSVAGISFSVTVVALQLASQQLSPRVLRTFQSDRLSQGLLGALVGTFAYCLVVLGTLDARGAEQLPNLSLAVAIVAAVLAFALFVAFIHNIVISLQASTLIRRMAQDGQAAIARRFPASVGLDPDDEEAARRAVEERRQRGRRIEVRAPRAGFLTELFGEEFLDELRDADALVVQRARLGDFLVTGALLAEAWAEDAADDGGLAERIAWAFVLGDERTVVVDVAFPVRQLADVALRGLSPSLNDPTTAENAMNSLADTLIRFVHTPPPPAVRVDGGGVPRLVALPPSLDDLVRLGFEQVRVKCAEYPVVAARLLVLLAEIDRAARDCGRPSREVDRQTRLLADTVRGEVPTQADAEHVERVREALHETASDR